MDPLTNMYDVPFEKMLEVGKFSDEDLYNLMKTNEKNRNRIIYYLKGKNKNKLNVLFFKATKKNNIELLKILIETVDINKQNKNDKTFLMYATELGQTEVVQLLIENGVDLNKEQGWTALRLAINKNNKKIIKILIENYKQLFKKRKKSKEKELV